MKPRNIIVKSDVTIPDSLNTTGRTKQTDPTLFIRKDNYHRVCDSQNGLQTCRLVFSCKTVTSLTQTL